MLAEAGTPTPSDMDATEATEEVASLPTDRSRVATGVVLACTDLRKTLMAIAVAIGVVEATRIKLTARTSFAPGVVLPTASFPIDRIKVAALLPAALNAFPVERTSVAPGVVVAFAESAWMICCTNDAIGVVVAFSSFPVDRTRVVTSVVVAGRISPTAFRRIETGVVDAETDLPIA